MSEATYRKLIDRLKDRGDSDNHKYRQNTHHVTIYHEAARAIEHLLAVHKHRGVEMKEREARLFAELKRCHKLIMVYGSVFWALILFMIVAGVAFVS